MVDGVCSECGYKDPVASKEVEVQDDITVSQETSTAIQNYAESQESSLINDTSFKFAVKKQDPEDSEKKTAIESMAGNRTVTFYDASFTRTETIGSVVQDSVAITDTGDTVLSFTLPYDMTGRCNLAMYRYHGSEASQLTRVYTKDSPQDGTYYVEGSGADTRITVFASKFSAYGAGSTVLPLALASAGCSAYLSLDEKIDINFEMGGLGSDGKGSGFDKSKLGITVDGATIENTKIAYDSKNNTASCVLKSLEPKEIGTDWHIIVTYEGLEIKNFTYSVADYCQAVFNAQTAAKNSNSEDTAYDKLADLCTALLNYGKYAEDYANEKSSGVGSYTASGLNEGHPIDISGYRFGDIPEGGVTAASDFADATAGAASLELGSTIKLKYHVKTDVVLSTGQNDGDEQNFYVLNSSGKQIDPSRVTVDDYEGDDDKYNYTVSIDLYASQLATQYTLKLKGADTGKFSIRYGVYNYCSDAQDYDVSQYPAFTNTLKALCKAIHNYGRAVQAFLAD